MQVTATLRDGVSFEVASGSGHTLVTDGPPERGGADRGMRPMELMLAAVASCSAFDVVTILRRGKHGVADVRVCVTGARAATAPAVFTRISLAFAIPGVPAAPARRAVQLSVEKYCSALRMLAATAEIVWEIDA